MIIEHQNKVEYYVDSEVILRCPSQFCYDKVIVAIGAGISPLQLKVNAVLSQIYRFINIKIINLFLQHLSRGLIAWCKISKYSYALSRYVISKRCSKQ